MEHIIDPNLSLDTLRDRIMRYEAENGGKRPVVVLACAGFADEHWQIFNWGDHARGGDPSIVISRD